MKDKCFVFYFLGILSLAILNLNPHLYLGLSLEFLNLKEEESCSFLFSIFFR